jgi:hypothetical protein
MVVANQPPLFDDDPFKDTYRPMNPSIIAVKDGYLMNLRCVNYKQENGIYTYLDGSGKILTKNIIIKYDRRLMKTLELPLEDPIGGDIEGSMVNGLEDIRLFMWNDQLYGLTCTRLTCDIPQIALIKIKLTDTRAVVVSKELLVGPDGEQSCQKNWMPYISNGHLYIIYSHEPFTRLHYSTNKSTAVTSKDSSFTGNVLDVSLRHSLPINLSTFRGSGSPIPYKDGYLAVIHEVLFCPHRVYVHRFVMYDKMMTTIKAVTLPFYFFSKGIEYVCGFCMDHSGKNLLLSMGVNDAEAHLVKVSIETVEKMLLNISYKN